MIELENDRRYLKQWGLEQRVLIDGFLPGTWVDFSHLNDCKTSALTTEAYVEAGHVYANIPNILLQLPGYLHVYVNPPVSDLVHTPEERDIKIVRQEKPSYYIYTETPTVSYKNKADAYWGAENAGKVLVIGEDGYLTPADAPPSSGGNTSVEDDGEGNISLDIPGLSVIDDGSGNITIG